MFIGEHGNGRLGIRHCNETWVVIRINSHGLWLNLIYQSEDVRLFAMDDEAWMDHNGYVRDRMSGGFPLRKIKSLLKERMWMVVSPLSRKYVQRVDYRGQPEGPKTWEIHIPSDHMF